MIADVSWPSIRHPDQWSSVSNRCLDISALTRCLIQRLALCKGCVVLVDVEIPVGRHLRLVQDSQVDDPGGDDGL